MLRLRLAVAFFAGLLELSGQTALSVAHGAREEAPVRAAIGSLPPASFLFYDVEFAPGSIVSVGDGGAPVIEGSDGVVRPLVSVARPVADTRDRGIFSLPFSVSFLPTYRIPTMMPLGPATMRDGSGAVARVSIVPRRFELFADSLLADGQPIRLSRPAKPGGRITLDGTGLGLSPLNAKIAVHVGSLRLAPEAALVPETVGVERLSLVLPEAVPLGCAVPLVIEVDGQATLLTRALAIATPGRPCPEAAAVYPLDLVLVEQGYCVPAALVEAGHLVGSRASGQTVRTPPLRASITSLELPTGDSGGANESCRLVKQPTVPISRLLNGIPTSRLPFSVCSVNAIPFQASDAQGRPLSMDATAAVPWESIPEPALSSGTWRLRSSAGEWPVALIQLRWLNRLDAAALTLDRDYNVVWDTTGTREGDRVELALTGSNRQLDFALSCPADARQGVLRVPASMLREVSRDFTGTAASLTVTMTRPTELRRLESYRDASDSFRPGTFGYLMIKNVSSESRSVVIP